ncbi:hypothetical protein MHUMG1_02577 [Metarhizium humberi]|uniref:ARF-like GTPase ARLP2, atypical n=1 Tax=Metarhizium humberi TaxID=2596975 RepID=A0A9P8MH56_9HYPO|nr:hypothetical protein MHUMG1_02577 [Metarhizium humberi]
MKLASWLFGKNPEYRGLMMGFDAAGKTTLLYRLKLPNEKITTIPTIGFNVETVESTKGHKFTLWDVGGMYRYDPRDLASTFRLMICCDKMRPLYRHYFQNTDVFFFIVDCADTCRFDDVVPEIQSLLNELDSEHGKKNLWVVLNKQDLLPPNERDEALKQIRTKLEKGLSRSVESGRVRIFGPPGFNAFEHGHAAALLDQVADAIQGDKSPKPLENGDKPLSSHVGETDLKERINENAKRNTSSADDFWQGFLDADLPVWDHYNHLRAGYFVLLEGMACGNTLMKCADMFMDHVDMLRSKRPERFRNTTHRTMTIFWLFQLQVATIRYAHFKHLSGLTCRDDFPQILLHTPELMDASLWKVHYSKDLMFAPNARANWVLPDKSPLPSIAEPVQHESSPGDIPHADSDHLIRFALTVIQSTSGTRLRRGAVIKHALSALQTSIMQKRASMPNIGPYSETQAYFWIQYVHAALASLQSSPGDGSSRTAGWHGSMTSLTLTAFKSLFDISGDEWKRYYSPTLWDSMQARIAFVNPDQAPLPGLISIPPQSSSSRAKLHMASKAGLGVATTPRMPPSESLAVMVAAVCDAAALSDTDAVDGVVKSHPELIAFLYDTLVANLGARAGPDDRPTATSKRRSGLVEAVNKALGVSGPSAEGLTCKMFWIQQVLVAVEQTAEQSSFDSFMNSNPHLAYEGLPLMYYSEMILNSSEAKVVFLPPDRRPFPSVISGGGEMLRLGS